MNASKTLLHAGLMITFAKIVESGSLSAAARNMKMDKAAISRQLKSLEEQLDVKLLNRSSRELGITDVGRIVYERAARVVHEVESAQAEAESFRLAESGVLTVCAPVAFGNAKVVPLMASFSDKFPNIELELCLLDRNVDLFNESFDILLQLSSQPPGNLLAHRLGSVEYAVVMAASASQRYCRIKDPRDLTGENCLFYGFKSRRAVWRFRGDEMIIDVEVCTRLSVNNNEAIHDLALNGRGIAMLPRYIVSSDIKSGRLQEMFPEYSIEGHLGHSVFALHRPGCLSLQKITAFVEHLKTAWASPVAVDAAISASEWPQVSRRPFGLS